MPLYDRKLIAQRGYDGLRATELKEGQTKRVSGQRERQLLAYRRIES